MGKDKEQRNEAPGNAFWRMNYLYQAAQLMSRISDPNTLGNYYNKIMKEISKKVLERLHPDLKRTICSACHYSLTAGSSDINVKIKTHKKKKRRKNMVNRGAKKYLLEYKNNDVDFSYKYSRLQIEARKKRPNTICWSCGKCGYSKCFLQNPSKKLWIHETEDKV